MRYIVHIINDETKDKELDNHSCIITYVCREDRANFVADKVREKTGYKNVEVIKASGLNSLYASNGGIIVSYSY